MQRARKSLVSVLVLLLVAGLVMPVAATTLIRAGLDELVASNEMILMGEIVDLYSYWNADGTFILTDVRIRPLELVKGALPKGDLTVTLMGGTVGDTTTLILGSPELVPGKPYVLFLNPEDLPGVRSVMTVRDHCQGVFDLITKKDELFAVSQANTFSLLPDANGFYKAPGEIEGFQLDEMLKTIHEITERLDGAPRR